MANSREGQLQRDINKDMTACGWMAGTAGGYVLKGEYVSELELPHHRLTKREEKRLCLEVAVESCGLSSVIDVRSGKPHDLEKQRLAEIIDRLNDLYGAEVSDDDKLHFARDIADRIERNEAVMDQVCTHNETKVMHGMFPRMVSGGLRKKEKISVSLLSDEKEGRKFAPLIVKLLAEMSSRDLCAE